MDLLFGTLSELGSGLRRRRFSSVELTRLALDRLESLGPRYNAVAAVVRERALREARAADRRLRDGRGLGPLVGIPYGAKDLLAARGAPTTWGTRPYARQVFDYDAAVIARLRASGAVLVAKLRIVALAGGGGCPIPLADIR